MKFKKNKDCYGSCQTVYWINTYSHPTYFPTENGFRIFEKINCNLFILKFNGNWLLVLTSPLMTLKFLEVILFCTVMFFMLWEHNSRLITLNTSYYFEKILRSFTKFMIERDYHSSYYCNNYYQPPSWHTFYQFYGYIFPLLKLVSTSPLNFSFLLLKYKL